ncbi:MAG: GNAT family N-acetyltransferase [Saprospiraceae bacterium]
MLNLRPGTAADLPTVYALVGELADYEKAPHEFTATLEDYRRDFADGMFEIIVAEEEAEGKWATVGMALYYLTYSTWKGRMLYLEDFIVRQAHRRRGIGDRLFDAFLERAAALDCRVVKWQVLDWNEPAVKFYEKKGATIEREWWNGKMTIERGD